VETAALGWPPGWLEDPPRGAIPAFEFTTKDTKSTKGPSRRNTSAAPAGYPARDARLGVLGVLCGSPSTASCLGPGLRRD